MVSLSIHPNTLCSLTTTTTTTAANVSSFFPRRPISPYSLLPSAARIFSIRRRPPSLSSATAEAAAAAAEALETPNYAAGADPQVADELVEEKKPLRVVVKGQEKPRLVLRFIWMEKNIGLALDQVIPGHGTVPLSPYYWWPRKDAWEELKSKLEEKPWISQKRMIIILNQATDIINLWQQSGAANL